MRSIQPSLRNQFRSVGILAGLLLTSTAYAGAGACVVPDNGSGTVDLPPMGCGYVSPQDLHMIIDGLPPGTEITVAADHFKFFQVQTMPGGNLGGEVEIFQSILQFQMTGTGDLAGFNRTLFVQAGCEVHTGPRTPGDAVQDFDTEMVQLQGQIFGDPDFDLLRVTAGGGFGLPSPGHTTLTQLPAGDFNVDSFFDITYSIEFVGAPGSVLGGLAGNTTATVTMSTGEPIMTDPPDVLISEIRTDQPSSDNDEYFELIGEPGTSLDGLTYLVLGDGAGGSGVIETVVDLTGLAIPADGHFLAVEQTFSLVPQSEADLITSMSFENSDNVTHMIVFGFTGATDDDLDLDDDCVLDITPWNSVVDTIGLVESAPPECNYGPNLVGPDGTFVPGHVFRCGPAGTWVIGGFTAPTDDTPGTANLPCPPITVFGIPNTALGNATLDTSGGTLVVSNIGSSGKDGVSIDLGEAADGVWLDLPSISTHGPLIISNLGSSGCDGVSIIAPDPTVGATAFAFRCDGLNPTGLRIDAYIGELLVHTEVFSPIPPDGVFPVVSNIGSSGKDGVSIQSGGNWTVDSFFDITYRLATPTTIGGTFVQADLVRASLEGLPPGTPAETFQNAVVIGTSQIEIGGEGIVAHESVHTVQGEPQLTTNSSGHLVVSNLGSSGKDGVSIDLDNDRGFQPGGRVSIHLDPLEMPNESDSMSMYARGNTLSASNRDLGRMRLNRTATTHALSADYSSLGATGIRVQVLAGGIPNGEVLIPGGLGDLGQLDPTSGDGTPLRATACGKIQPDPPCFFIEFDSEFLFTPVGGGVAGGNMLGDELRVLADGATTSIQRIDLFDIGGSSLDNVTITDIEIGDEPCLGDTDNSGTVDVDDLINVILDWNTNGAGNNGDVNGSGLVDVDDLVDVILAWGPC